MQSRRAFLKTTLLTGTGLALFPHLTGFSSYRPETGSFHLGGLVPFSIMEDVSESLRHNSTFEERIVQGLNADINQEISANSSRIAIVVPPKTEFIVQYARECKENSGKIGKEDFDSRKFSFTLGWMIARAIGESFMPACASAVSDKEGSFEEMQLYQDAHLINILSDKKTRNSNKKELTAFFMAAFPRMLGRIHTYNADPDYPGEWIIRMSEYRKKNKEKLELLAGIIDKPNENKQARYVKRLNFYNSREVKKLNQVIAGNENDASFSPNSLYAKAISNSYKYLSAFDKYFTSQITLEKFKQKFI